MRQDLDVEWQNLVAILLTKLVPDGGVVTITRADVAAVQARFAPENAVLQTIAYDGVMMNDLTSPIMTLEVIPYRQALRDNESMGELH